MRKLGIGIIGAGFWGRNHARNLKELDETRLVAICDQNKKRAEIVAEKFGIEAFTNSTKMLRHENIEAVTVCTWSTNLAKETLRALEAGKHVLVEKPMANDVQEAQSLVNLAKKKGLHLMVGFLMRFIPGIHHIKTAIENGKIGTLVYATARRVSQWPERIGDVGVVKDLAIHDIDITRYLFSSDPIEVYANAGSLRHKKFEDYAQILLSFEGNKTAYIESNWLTPYKIRKLIVTGSDAIMNLDYITQEITVETTGQTVTPRYQMEEPLKMELQNFATSILNDVEPSISGVDGLKALGIAEMALKSAQEHRAIKICLKNLSAFEARAC